MITTQVQRDERHRPFKDDLEKSLDVRVRRCYARAPLTDYKNYVKGSLSWSEGVKFLNSEVASDPKPQLNPWILTLCAVMTTRCSFLANNALTCMNSLPRPSTDGECNAGHLPTPSLLN